MKVTREKEEQSQAFINIEMESSEVDAATEAAYKKLSKKYRIPGFRKGKAPRELVEQYIGVEALLDEAINEIAPDACERAIKEQEITPIGPPQVEVKGMDPLTFSVVVPLPPTVETGDYRSVRVAVPEPSFKDTDIDRVIEDLRNQYASYDPEEKAIESGDLAVIDVSSTVEDKPFINQEEAQYQVFKDSTAPLPGFADALIGLKAGDVKELKLMIPDDIEDKDKAGKEASFKVSVKEVKRRNLPELNDEFAQRIDQVQPKFKNVDELRERITNDLKERAEQADKNNFREQVLDAVVAGAKVEFPPVMVESETQIMIEDQMRQFGLADNKEQYYKIIGKTEAELIEEVKPLAEKRISRALVLGKIASEEKVTPLEEEIKAEITAYTSQAGDQQAEYAALFENPENRNRLAEMIVSRKTVELVEAIARGEDVPAPPAEAEAETTENPTETDDASA